MSVRRAFYGGISKPASPPPPPATQPIPVKSPPVVTTTPPGLLNSSLTQTSNRPYKYKPTTSVNDNVNQLTDSDSLYMQQARQSGLNTAASRGLLNSSIASGAAQGAAIKAATPIAQQDAQTEYNKWNLEKSVQSNLQGKYVESVDEIIKNATININAIETAEGLSQEEKDKMIMNSIERRDADLAFQKSLFSALPVWSNNWSSFPVMPGAPGVVLGDS